MHNFVYYLFNVISGIYLEKAIKGFDEKLLEQQPNDIEKA
jgi:hypothetical protein